MVFYLVSFNRQPEKLGIYAPGTPKDEWFCRSKSVIINGKLAVRKPLAIRDQAQVCESSSRN
jgi:hypothetical protein